MEQNPSLTGAHILLVEDNEFNQAVALEFLSEEDISVTVATHGAQALDLLAHERFDAVLMDCQMPVMDGYAATRALRQQPKFRDLPVIAMTADDSAGDRAKALEAGMNDYISKPIEVDAFLATLSRWVVARR